MKLKFIKMNGAGNDFVIIDARGQRSAVSGQLSMEQVRMLSHRDNQVTKGCDQLIILENPPTLALPLPKKPRMRGGLGGGADVFMRIYGVDGGEVDACGNATRCIADMLYKELGKLPVTIETNAGILLGVKKIDDYILVDMGEPKFGWQDIPLAMPIEEAAKKVTAFCGLKNPIFVNMGNPHAVFFVEKLPTDAEVKKIGAKIENYTEVFPQRVNVSFATINDGNTITAKVWERSAGLTAACGTGACAMLAAANQRDNNIREAVVLFENSMQSVSVKLEKDGHILLGGAVETEFAGEVKID